MFTWISTFIPRTGNEFHVSVVKWKITRNVLTKEGGMKEGRKGGREVGREGKSEKEGHGARKGWR